MLQQFQGGGERSPLAWLIEEPHLMQLSGALRGAVLLPQTVQQNQVLSLSFRGEVSTHRCVLGHWFELSGSHLLLPLEGQPVGIRKGLSDSCCSFTHCMTINSALIILYRVHLSAADKSIVLN